jgi:hypothetical protein
MASGLRLIEREILRGLSRGTGTAPPTLSLPPPHPRAFPLSRNDGGSKLRPPREGLMEIPKRADTMITLRN